MTADRLGRRQQGAALLLMMLAVLVSVTAVLVSRLSTSTLGLREQNVSLAALADARRALLAHVSLAPDRSPGGAPLLPCPDLDASGAELEGEAHAACGAAGVSMLGRFPWRTLGLEPPRDGTGACLWYVVSGSLKAAGTATATLVNADTNGQLQLTSIDTGGLLHGSQAEDRPVAAIIAPMRALDGQTRLPATAPDQCGGYDPFDYLDTAAGLGISNAALSGTADTVDSLAQTTVFDATHNDRIAVISQRDLSLSITGRHDHRQRMTDLGLAVTRCLAQYGRENAGGTDDRRLPWPAPLDLGDYRVDAAYDDLDSPLLAGRLPDTVGDSSAATGGGVSAVLSACDPGEVPEWSTARFEEWQHWKDHFFYVVAESFAPPASVPSSCTSCINVNGAGDYAAVVLYAGPRLPGLAQVRSEPPIDADSKREVANYLEGANLLVATYSGGSVDLVSATPSASFNDVLFCVDTNLDVSEC